MGISFASAFNLPGVVAYVAELTKKHVETAKSRDLAILTYTCNLNESSPDYVKVLLNNS